MQRNFFNIYQHFNKRMNQFYEENAVCSQKDIVFLGDSLVEMMKIEKMNLDNAINRGIVSDNTYGILSSLNDRVLVLNPKKVILFIGSNDICNGYLLSEIYENYKLIIQTLKKNNKDIKIIAMNIIPPCYYLDNDIVDRAYPDCRDINKIMELNERLKQLAIDENYTYFDTFKIVADENNSLRVKHTLDGVHLNEEAYDMVYAELIKVI